ncbi:MAG TPA: serine/threonine-protein kinase [Polyangiaceae bacterium]|nr:serine/threonine-protein kinase [Polyangiaceae bacterium]
MWFGTLCAIGAVVVLVLNRPGGPGVQTSVVLAIEAGLCSLLARLGRPTASLASVVRVALLIAIGLLTAWPAYFFGPNGWFAALLVTVLCLVGVLGEDEHGRTASRFFYLALAAGQAVVFALVATHTIPDVSLAPVIVGSHPMAHHAAAHLFVQGIYLAAFLSARTFNKRYRAIAVQLEVAGRAEMIRAALLQEARADYRRALRIGRRGLEGRGAAPSPRDDAATVREALVVEPDTEVDSPATIASSDVVSEEVAVARVFDGAASSSDDAGEAEKPAARSDAWLKASNDRMRRVFVMVIAVCASGAALLGVIAVHRGPLYVAWACTAGIAAAVWAHNVRVLRHGDAGEHWPWTIAGVLSVGPAFSMGLHSAFAAFIVAPLFLGGLFRATDRAAWGGDRRGRIWIGIAVAHATAFALVYTGVLPDLGNVPILVEGVPRWEGVAQHAMLQGVYATAFAAGVTVDRRYEALMEQARAASRRAAREQATLLAATREIDRLLGGDAEAIFLHQQIGPYRLQRLLGRGGMGDVYEGVDMRSGERFAVKLVRRERAADPTSLRLFAEEARALGRVQSPYVARVVDAGGIEGDLPYIAMELVEGQPLSAVLQRRGRLPLRELRALVRDVARGLTDVHSAAVVHRDVKPQNIILTGSNQGDRWKLVDFGVAQVQDLMGGVSGVVVVGTPQYMAPEQASGKPVDARADLYSLCLVVYRALTGRPALVGDPQELARARLRPPPHPRIFVDVPWDVELALRIGLSVRPADRFRSAAELTSAFEDAFEGRLALDLRRRGEQLLAQDPWTAVARVPVPAVPLPKTISERGSGESATTTSRRVGRRS